MTPRKSHRENQANRLGFVGLGIMGSAFSKHLLAVGFDVRGFDREAQQCALLEARGGCALASSAAVAAACEVVFTALASYSAYEAAYFGSGGIVGAARRGGVVVDLSTMPLARKADARERLDDVGLVMLDCPISGTGAQAQAKDVAVYASGPARVVHAVRPMLEECVARFGTSADSRPACVVPRHCSTRPGPSIAPRWHKGGTNRTPPQSARCSRKWPGWQPRLRARKRS